MGQRVGLEQTLADAVTLNEDAWPAIDHFVLESIGANKVLDGIVFRSRLQPECWNVQLHCLLEQAQCHLSPRLQKEGRIAEVNLPWGLLLCSLMFQSVLEGR